VERQDPGTHAVEYGETKEFGFNLDLISKRIKDYIQLVMKASIEANRKGID
jgi:hypothetical protein